MDIGERIYQRRRLLDLTQQQLAEQAGVVGKTLGMWERGERIPKGDALQKLATALNTSVAYLMGETDDPKRHQASILESTGREEYELTGNPPPPLSEDAMRRRQRLRNLGSESGELQASQDLDGLIRELASINPDLIVNFRTTKQHWKDLSPDTKKKIAQGMMFVLGLAELREEDGFKTPKSDEDL